MDNSKESGTGKGRNRKGRKKRKHLKTEGKEGNKTNHIVLANGPPRIISLCNVEGNVPILHAAGEILENANKYC